MQLAAWPTGDKEKQFEVLPLRGISELSCLSLPLFLNELSQVLPFK